MARKENKIMRRRLASAYLSSLVSISLVLLLVGVAALLLINSKNVSDYFKKNMKLSVMFKTEVTEQQALEYQPKVDGMQFTATSEFISKERGEREMKAMLGEDFLSVFETWIRYDTLWDLPGLSRSHSRSFGCGLSGIRCIALLHRRCRSYCHKADTSL